VNNVVDVTNFVLHELGQPLHAFDADRLKGRKIVVKNMPEGTPFVTLDGIERKLAASDLMICDGEQPVAIGGVFGGLHSGVTGTTENIFIESAYFDPVSVRITAKRHNISTDASFRFERGVDPEMTIVALKRCALLIKEIAGGKISSPVIDEYPSPMHPVRVFAAFANIDRLIGKKINRVLLHSILVSLDFKIMLDNEEGFDLEVPSYRVDVTREADVIEEILRIYGYNNVEVSETLHASLSYSPRPDKDKLVDLVSEFMVGNGFNEIMCNSLTSAAYYESLETWPVSNLVRIKNPLSNELDSMRQTLLFGGLETIQYNANRQHPDLRLFEFGNCYNFHVDRGTRNPLEKYQEEFILSLFITGKRTEPNWATKEESASFYLLKAYLENLFIKLGLEINTFQVAPIAAKSDVFTAGLAYQRNNLPIAEIAVIKQTLLKSFDLRNDVFYAEVYWENLMKARGDHKVKNAELPKFPEVRRDLALLLDKSVTFEQIREIAAKTERKLLTRINLFDIYEGEQIEKNKKSYAVSFILQDQEATLTDERIDRIMKRLMEAYQKELSAEIR
jgi:phenylalanyl-tRNA synthetase beta chain